MACRALKCQIENYLGSFHRCNEFRKEYNTDSYDFTPTQCPASHRVQKPYVLPFQKDAYLTFVKEEAENHE